MKLLSVLFIILIFCVLTNSPLSLSYAGMGLELWFGKMIPSLLPFMILSGIMVRLKITERFSMVIYPVIHPVFRVRKNVCYAMLMGFLCGFPMGARVVDDLYSREMISRREAEYLLAFCNNIGPVYFCSIVLPLLKRSLILPYLFGMYGIPLLYGLILRYTLFSDLGKIGKHNLPGRRGAELVSCERAGEPCLAGQLMNAVNGSVQASVQSILTLGGYMILFNLLNLLPHLLLQQPPIFFAPLLEITGGLIMLGATQPLYSLLSLSFGGLCCIAQTYSCIGQSDLSMGSYVLHKVLLTLLNAFFFLAWYILSPGSFLK